MAPPALLPPLDPRDVGKKCLVLDLDETLVHSSFKPIPHPEYIIPVEIDGMVHHVYVRKRPGCDTYLRMMARYYEIVIFTASLSKVGGCACVCLEPTGVLESHRGVHLIHVSCGVPPLVAQYADPLLDKLDPYRYIRSRLYREHCTFHMVW
jgi:RNA polymerase II subunit A small phosphatase-like protein